MEEWDRMHVELKFLKSSNYLEKTIINILIAYSPAIVSIMKHKSGTGKAKEASSTVEYFSV